MVKINGSSFALQYKRTTGRPIDSTATFKTLEDATSYARNTDAEEYFPYPGQIISVEVDGGIYKLLIDTEIPDTDGRKHYKLSPVNTGEESDGKYISKIKNDEAKGNITFLAGIDVKTKAVIQKIIAEYATFSKEISSEEYVQNLLGWLITPAGDIDAKSLRLRDFLEVPELRYNRVSVITGEEWNAPGGGIIESVDEENRIVYLKLEPGEVAAVEVDDICKANFNNDTGFQTTYFRITEKLDNGSFKYVLRSGYTYHPQKAMHFVCYGNFTNAERQKSSYSTQNYIRFLKGVNNWEITKDMIAMQLGDLSNLKLFGMDMTGHSAYLNRIYMTGTIKQISNDGVTEVPVPAFKGEWKSGTYWYYDEVTHNGSTWICIESTTTQEPSDSSTDWLKVISKGEDGASGKGVKSIVEQYYLSTSQTSLTGGSWSTTPPTWEKGKYIWTRSVITYTDDSTTTTDPISVTGGAGENGIGVKSVDVFYYLSSSSSELIGGEWSTNAPTWVNGMYMWSKTKTTYTDGTFVESKPVCITGSQGIPGKDGVDGKTSYFHIKYSPVENPTASQMTDTPNKYIGTYVDFVQASSNDPSKYTWALFKGDDGIPGTNGENGQTSYLHIKYSDDGKTFTANNGETPGVYMGVYVDFIQADSSVFSDYTWSKIKGEDGQDGQDGKDGKGVRIVDVLYYLSTSSSSLVGGSWLTTPPAWVNGKYMWSKTKVTYTDNTTSETSPVCITGSKGSDGTNGSDGEDGRGISSIIEQYYLSTSSNSLVGGSWSTTPPAWENGKYIWTRSVITYTDSTSTTTNPICSTGSTGETGIGVKSVAEQYYLSTSYSTPTGGSWQTSVPAWQDGKYIWTRVVITYTNNTYTETDPVCVTGGKGPSGNDGVGISAVDVLFYLSTSSSSLEGGSWSTTSPKWEDGKYLWTKTKVTYTNGSTWESDPACITGSQGKTGLPGAMLRPRGVWKANTEYYNNETFIDTVIYDGQNKLCKITHTSTSSFDSTKWEEFSEFENIATNVLLAQNATIDVLGSSGIFVGNLDKTKGWIMTEGSIKHNVTGVELTSDGKISLPETGGINVGGKTFIEAGKIKTEFIDVDTLQVTHLKGAIGSFEKLTAGDGSITFGNSSEGPSSALNIDFSKTWFGGDLYHQGYIEESDGTKRSLRFYSSDIWCRGEFGHRTMTHLSFESSSTSDFFAHIYNYGTDTTYHKYAESGQPIDCISLGGTGNYVLYVCDSPQRKMLTIMNTSGYPKRIMVTFQDSAVFTLEPYRFKIFITAEINTDKINPNRANNLRIMQ